MIQENILKVRRLGTLPKPITPEDYERYFEAGAIRKKDLVIGKTYKGICRNSDEAIWDGKIFSYTRWKFGTSYIDTINHFEDDDGYDLFIPVE